MGDFDSNKIVRWVVVLLLLSFVSLGASAIFSAFKSKPVPTEALSNEPVDFSAPASARKPASNAKSKISSADALNAPKRPSLPKYSGDEPRPYLDTRSDAGASASSPIFNGAGDQSINPLNAGSGEDSRNYGGGSSDSRDPSSVSNKGNSGGSDSSVLSSLGGLASSLLGGSSGTSASSGGTSSGGGGGSNTTTTVTETSTTFIGTTGGGGYNGVTTGGFKVSVSIGVPLSKLEGTTSNGYKYQVNLTGQQVQ